MITIAPISEAAVPTPPSEPGRGEVILLVDDEPAVVGGIVRLLRRDFTLLTATSGAAALKVLETRQVAVVVSDMTMPGMSGLELLTRVRERVPDVISIMLTGMLDLKTATDAINRAGVFRFLTKPCPAGQIAVAVRDAVQQHRLLAARQALLEQTEKLDAALSAMYDGVCILDSAGQVSRANDPAFSLLGASPGPARDLTRPLQALLSNMRGNEAAFGGRILTVAEAPLSRGNRLVVLHDVTAIRAMEEELRHDAMTDALTGAANRRRYVDFLKVEQLRAQRYSHPISLLMIDADFFKKVNDQHGHATGDIVLKHIANILQSGVRSLDLVARIGGEEFVALLVETPLATAAAVAERLRAAVEERPVSTPAGPLRITVSIGVACVVGSAIDPDELTHRADEALYAAKRNGRNRVEIAPIGGDPAA